MPIVISQNSGLGSFVANSSTGSLVFGISKTPSAVPTSLYESNISMMTVDTTGLNTYDMTAYDSLGLDVTSLVSWTTSNASVATMSGNTVTPVGAGTCDIYPVGYPSVKCSLTVVSTMPSDAVLYSSYPGGKGGDVTGTNTTIVAFNTTNPLANSVLSSRLRLKHYVNSNANEIAFIKSPTNTHERVLPSINVGGTISPARFTAGTTTTAQRYRFTGISLTANSLVTADVSYSSNGYRYNSVAYGFSSASTTQGASVDIIEMRFGNNTRKIVGWSWDNLLASESALGSSATSSGYFVPQCFIELTDRAGYTDKVLIPNLGTLGRSYDLSAENVPSAWLNV